MIKIMIIGMIILMSGCRPKAGTVAVTCHEEKLDYFLPVNGTLIPMYECVKYKCMVYGESVAQDKIIDAKFCGDKK